MERLTKSFPARYKVIDEEQGLVEAIVSVFGIIDHAGERVMPGAFAAGLARKLPKVCWMHAWERPIGKTLLAEEWAPGDPRLPEEIRDYGGLWVRGQLNLDVEDGRDALSHLKFGSIDEFSIGYFIPKGGARRAKDAVELTELDCFEWSPVLVGANPATALLDAKALSGAANLPLADRERAWRSSAAERRVRTWAEVEDAPNARYARAFMVRDGEADQFTSYRLPFADVIDGELRAVPRALFAIAGALSGARGGVELSARDRGNVKARVAGYYARMREEFEDDTILVPWEEEKSMTDAAAAWKARYLGPNAEGEMTIAALRDLVDSLFYRALGRACQPWSDDETPLDERKALAAAAIDEFAGIAKRCIDTMLVDAWEGDTMAELKSGLESSVGAPSHELRAPSPSPETPPAGISFAEKLQTALAGVEETLTRAEEIASLRAKEGRTLSEERRAQIELLWGRFDALHQTLDAKAAPTSEEIAVMLAKVAAQQRELRRIGAV